MRNLRPQHKPRDSNRQALLRFAGRRPLVRDEVQAAFKNDARFPPILSLEQAAELAHFAQSTLKRLASEGCFCNSVRRGKPIAFWRDRFVVEVMELDNARIRNKHSKSQKNRKEDNANETN